MKLHSSIRFLSLLCICVFLLCILSVYVCATSETEMGYCDTEEEWKMPVWGAVAIIAGCVILVGAAVYALLWLYYRGRK